jgi:glycosyltransferase involved in cell wall biosynthesis
MNILTVSTLYPNPMDAKHGIFVQTRIQQLKRRYPDVNITVIAPVPYFPIQTPVSSFIDKDALPFQRVDEFGIEVYHPRYLTVPKLGMFWAPFSLTKCLKNTMTHIDKSFDLIDGHYFFPDGVAIKNLASFLQIPFVCTARGTDINLIPQNPLAKSMIKKVLIDSHFNLAVCDALKSEMIALGSPQDKTMTVRNGVDLERFKWSDPTEQLAKKAKFGIQNQLVVSIGGLVERKGHHLTIQAIADLNDSNITLAIAGNGPELSNLKKLAKQLNIEDRVLFLGVLNQSQVNEWFMAADLSVLASSREGWANVLLESMASGCPVVATNVWGTPEVVSEGSFGELCERTTNDIALKIKKQLNKTINREAVRRYAERFSWEESSTLQFDLFSKVNDA